MPSFYNIVRARKFKTAADTALEISPHNSATPNFSIDAGGKLSWSSGSANADTTLYRSAANTLKTDDSFDIASGNTYKIDGNDVLTSTTLGSSIVNSSLTSLGNISSLNAVDATITGLLSMQEVSEVVATPSVVSNTVTCSISDGALFYTASSFTGNLTIAVTNVPTTNARAITFTLVVLQGGTGRVPTSLTVNGSSSTIRWAQNTAPTPSSNSYDIFSFTLFRPSSTWIAFANANTGFPSA